MLGTASRRAAALPRAPARARSGRGAAECTEREGEACSSWPHASQTSREAGSDSPQRGHVILGSVMLVAQCTPLPLTGRSGKQIQ